MITFQQETLYDIMHEVNTLLKMHYEELALNKDVVKLEPIWEDYALLEKIGRFVVYTARDSDKLIGYSAFFINKHLHYAKLIVAINDVIFLHPEYRKSTCGYRLIKYCDEKLTDRGDINKITFHVKCSLNWTNLLTKLGYTADEIVCGKMIGA